MTRHHYTTTIQHHHLHLQPFHYYCSIHEKLLANQRKTIAECFCNHSKSLQNNCCSFVPRLQQNQYQPIKSFKAALLCLNFPLMTSYLLKHGQNCSKMSESARYLCQPRVRDVLSNEPSHIISKTQK